MTETNKKKVRKLLNKYIFIEWVDSTSLSGIWNYEEAVLGLNLETIESIGFVVHEDKEFITLAAHIGPDQIAGTLCIPRAVIKKTKILKIK